MAHKVGDTVTVTRGPHKGDAHKVIHVHKDGRVNVKPHNKMPHQIKYRHGAATAKSDEVKKMNEKTVTGTRGNENHVRSNRAMHSFSSEHEKSSHARHMSTAHNVTVKYHGDDEVSYHGPKKGVKKALGNHYGGDHDHAKEEHPHIYKEDTMLQFEAWMVDTGWKKPSKVRKDKFGNVVKDKNVAKNLARKAMKKTKDNEKKQVDEIARSMTPMRDKFGKSKAEKEAEKKKNYPDHLTVDKAKKAFAPTKGGADAKKEGTIITPKGFKMTNNDKEKLQKIQKMLKRDKAVAKKSTHPGPNEDVDEACWDSHKQVGYKMKGGRRVPNCVPKNENQNAALQKKLAKSAQSSEKGKAAVTLKKAPFKIPSKADMKNEVLDKDKDHMSYRQKAKYSADRARNSATAKIVRGDDGVDKEKNTMRKRAAGMAMSDRKGVRQFRKFHGYDKKK